MTKTAWVFPGQGSQQQGMGTDLLHLPLAKDKLAQAEEILGWSVSEICQNDEELARTLYTQPCLYVVESILADMMRVHEQPDLVAGHSLGEYTALYVAKVFDWSTGLQLVKHRASLMENAAGGMMAALIDCDREQLDKVIAEIPNVVLANDNSPTQVVISGTPEAVQTVMSKVKAKRALPLKVSGAFHSPLMADAAAEFQEALKLVEFQQAFVPVLSNVEPVPTVDPNLLKQRLIQQISSPVRWRETSLALSENAVKRVVEIGPRNVLTGLAKRTCPDFILENVRSAADLPA
ncbi:MAG: ACP S-malonyltransferase [Rhizonema sp. NSF051]|nr:ACP S-malonyltransferase [Rhizonema sp. NSF051]